MSWRSALRAVFRLGLAASVALSGMSFSAGDAEARRGGKVRTSQERTPQERSTSDDHSTKHKSDEQQGTHGADDAGGSYVPRVRSRGASRGSSSESTNEAGGLALSRPYRPRPAAVSATPVQDTEVQGCPTGMICTVCLAGCAGEVGGIIHAQSKTPVPIPEN